MKTPETRNVTVWNGQLDFKVQVAGRGEPLVYLHSAGGLSWDPMLDRLADQYTVYAPIFPGTHPDPNPNAIDKLDNLWDVVLAYDDLLIALGLDSPRLIGLSFGGMLAAELAAHRRAGVRKLVVMGAIGLWRADAPYTVGSWAGLTPEELSKALFHRLDRPLVQQFLTPPADPDAAAEALVNMIWTVGCTAKVIWPIPDKGLRKRIHRVTAPSLVIWGQNDGLIPPVYAEEFGRALPNAEVFMIPECGHMPALEQPDILIDRVQSFLAH